MYFSMHSRSRAHVILLLHFVTAAKWPLHQHQETVLSLETQSHLYRLLRWFAFACVKGKQLKEKKIKAVGIICFTRKKKKNKSKVIFKINLLVLNSCDGNGEKVNEEKVAIVTVFFFIYFLLKF